MTVPGFRSMLAWVLLTGFALAFALPFLWMLGTSVTPQDEMPSGHTDALKALVPDHPTLVNYPRALKTLNFLPYLANTLYVCILTVLGTLVSCTLTAYGFSRIRWAGRDALFALMLSTIMLPTTVLLLPQFVLFRGLGWIGSYKPLIVPAFFGNAFFIFLLRQFFLGIPQELSDAARIEGASELRILWSILLPLSKPALATVIVFSFVWAWTDFMGPLVYLNDDRMYTLTVGLSAFLDRHEADWSGLMAGTALVSLPLAVLFLFTQRAFIRGIQRTGIKG